MSKCFEDIILLLKFIDKCDEQDVTPHEKHIDEYLKYVKRTDLRNEFIKFCFYDWETRDHLKKVYRLLCY